MATAYRKSCWRTNSPTRPRTASGSCQRAAARRRPARAVEASPRSTASPPRTACARPISMAAARKCVVNAPLTGSKAGSARLSRQDAAGVLRAGRVDARRSSARERRRGARHLHHRLGRRRPRRHPDGEFHRASICSGCGKDGAGRGRSWPRAIRRRGRNPDRAMSPVARSKPAKTRFLAAIEPWHGNQVSVYSRTAGAQWERQVIDDALVDGHTILTADLNGDGTDEIIAGFRGAAAQRVPLQLRRGGETLDAQRPGRRRHGGRGVRGGGPERRRPPRHCVHRFAPA